MSPGARSNVSEPRRSQDVFNRLVRTLSGNTPGSATSDTQTALTSTNASQPSNVIAPDLQQGHNESSQGRKRRLSFTKHLKGFGKDTTKLGSNGGKARYLPTSPSSSSKGLQSPPSPRSSSQITINSNTSPSVGHIKDLSMVNEEADTRISLTASDQPPEPTVVASKIQAITDSLPPPPSVPEPILKTPKPPARDASGRPIPPPGSIPIQDPKFISVLSSASIMNGSEEKGRMSVWSVLESLEVPRPGIPSEDDNEGDSKQNDPGSDLPSNTSSIMIYFPLLPTKEDVVEIAEHVPISLEKEGTPRDANDQESTSGWVPTVWPFSSWYPQEKEGMKPIVISKHVWIPSSTKLSMQAMWWGYRLYLPPAIMGSLDNKQSEATKRAAMITTALTWFFNNLPMNDVPLTLRPTVLLLQRIVPLVGYIGTFISWSWGTIKSYDIGFGVILTATWVLPVALIPSTWREADFPKSLSSASPTSALPVVTAASSACSRP